jgi:hypothetical protein
VHQEELHPSCGDVVEQRVTEAAIRRCTWQIEDGARVECCTEPLGERGVEQWRTVDRPAQGVEADYRRIVARTLRAACTGMLHRLRTGILSRDLPEQFGDSRKVRCRRRTWLADGVWADMVKLLGEEGESAPAVGYEAAPALIIRTDLDAGALC